MSQSFDQQVALVTGGSTGIGAAAALLLAERGARVLITGRNESSLRETANRHERIDFLVADVSKAADVSRSIDALRKRYGRLDVLVNNAGILEIASLADASADHLRRVFDVNVLGLIETTRLALPLLRQSKGRIVNVASTVADEPFPNMSAYSASKAAVLALTRSWAQELGAEGIAVNAVSPGPIETSILGKQGMSDAQLEEMSANILGMVPSRRFGKPEEVAEVIGFLASGAASYVMGAQYTVGGGMEA